MKYKNELFDGVYEIKLLKLKKEGKEKDEIIEKMLTRVFSKIL